MAYLFTIENGVAVPTTEALLIEPFKTIWERDKTANHEVARKEFTYIEFMSSKKKSNPFAGYGDEDRHASLKALYFHEDWKIDSEIERGLITISEFQQAASVTYTYYQAALAAARKLQDFLTTFDMNEKSARSGAPVYKPADITKALIDTDKVLLNLDSLKNRVEQELFEQTKTKGNKAINPFEI